MPAIPGQSIAGPFLTSFLGAYTSGRQLADQERERSLNEGLTALKLQDFLRQRQEEQGVSDAAMAVLTRARRGLGSPAGIPTAVGTMPSVAGPPPNLAAGAPAAAGAVPGIASQPSTQEIVSGLPVEQELALMTTERGQRFLETYEGARQKVEQRARKDEAKGFFDQAAKALEAKDALGYANKMAAGFRRIEDFARAGEHEKSALGLIHDKEEANKANEDAAAIGECQKAWRADPGSPEQFQCALDALAAPKSAQFQRARMELFSAMLGKMLTPIEPLNAIYRDVAARLEPAFASAKAVTEQDQLAAWRAALGDPKHREARGLLLRHLYEGQSKRAGVIYDAVGMERPPAEGEPNDAEFYLAKKIAAQKYPVNSDEYFIYAAHLRAQLKQEAKEVNALDEEYKRWRNVIERRKALDEGDIEEGSLLLQRVGGQLRRLIEVEGAAESDPRVLKLRDIERYATERIHRGVERKQPPTSAVPTTGDVSGYLRRHGYDDAKWNALTPEQKVQARNEARAALAVQAPPPPTPATTGKIGTTTPTPRPAPGLTPKVAPKPAPATTTPVPVAPAPQPAARPALPAVKAPTPATAPPEPAVTAEPEIFDQEMVFADRAGKRWTLEPGTKPPTGSQVLGTLDEYMHGEDTTVRPPAWGGQPGPTPKAVPKAIPKPEAKPLTRTAPKAPSADVLAEANRLLREKVAAGEFNRIYSTIDQLFAYDREQLIQEAEANIRRRRR